MTTESVGVGEQVAVTITRAVQPIDIILYIGIILILVILFIYLLRKW